MSIRNPAFGHPPGMSDWEPVSTITRLPPATAAVPAENRALGVLLDDGTAGRPVHVEHLPPRAGREAPWPPWVPAEIIGALADRGIHAPWSHQADAAGHAQAGRNVDHLTGTASGKSLGYLLPALTAVLVRRDRALPRADQGARRRPARLDPCRWPCRGPGRRLRRRTPTAAERDWARSHARYLLTNPDMLHRSLLPGHARWSGFFRRLRYVVIDECHDYRGVFGSHVAQVLRRLRRVVAHHAPTGGPAGRSSCWPRRRSATPAHLRQAADRAGRRGGDRGRLAARAGRVRAVGAAADRRARRGRRARLRRTATCADRRPAGRPGPAGRPRPSPSSGPGAAPRPSRWPPGGRSADARRPLADRWPPTAAGYLPEDRRELEAALRDGRAARPGRHERARAGHRRHRPGRGAHRGLARAPARRCGSRPGRAGRGGPERAGGPHRPGRPARHLPGPPPRGRCSATRSRPPCWIPATRTCSPRTCAPPRPSCP